MRNYWSACADHAGVPKGAAVGPYVAQWRIEGETRTRQIPRCDLRALERFDNARFHRPKVIENYQKRFRSAIRRRELPVGTTVPHPPPCYDIFDKRALLGAAIRDWRWSNYLRAATSHVSRTPTSAARTRSRTTAREGSKAGARAWHQKRGARNFGKNTASPGAGARAMAWDRFMAAESTATGTVEP